MHRPRGANEMLLEKRSRLRDGMPREIHEDSVYWKSVTKDEPVTQKGDTFYASMPDGKKQVKWKPEEEAEAKKHLQGLMGKKESIDEAKDPAEEAIALSKSISSFLKGGPPQDDITVSTLQAHQAMKLYNLAQTLSSKIRGETGARLMALAKRDLPKYWDGKIPYSRRMKFTPAQRSSLGEAVKKNDPMKGGLYYSDEEVQAAAREWADQIWWKVPIKQVEPNKWVSLWVPGKDLFASDEEKLRQLIHQRAVEMRAKQIYFDYEHDPSAHYAGRTRRDSDRLWKKAVAAMKKESLGEAKKSDGEEQLQATSHEEMVTQRHPKNVPPEAELEEGVGRQGQVEGPILSKEQATVLGKPQYWIQTKARKGYDVELPKKAWDMVQEGEFWTFWGKILAPSSSGNNIMVNVETMYPNGDRDNPIFLSKLR